MTSRPSSPRRAFTLVEMLVVLGIIGILIGLLLPAVMMAVNNARRTQINAEIKQIEIAFDTYKLQKGEYPPSFGERDSTGTNLVYGVLMGTQNRYNSAVEKHLQRAYPKFRDPAKDAFYDLIDNHGANREIDQGEALVVWLRMMSANPANPFDTVSSRASYFEFDERRLVDVDGDGMPTYRPRHCRDTDYVYMESRSYSTYVKVDQYARVKYDTANNYHQTIPYFNPPVPVGSTNPPIPVNPSKFQIVCAGLDGNFGQLPQPPQYPYLMIMGTNYYNPKYFPNGDRYDPNGDMDNLTNFAEGQTLGDARPQ